MPWRRIIPLIMIVVIFALLAGMWTGLLRIGWAWPTPRPSLAGLHGPLMVSGFLGTLIGLERAVAMGRSWPFLSPILSGIGSLMLVTGLVEAGLILIVLGSLMLVAVSTAMVRQVRELYTVTMGLGALAWLGGNLLWLVGRPVYQASYWWAGFLLLIIAGERLELSRVLRPARRTKQLLSLAAAIFVLGLLVSLFSYEVGVRIASVGSLAMALWFVRFDIARRTIHKEGLTRYIGWNLLLGYFWLGVSGLVGLYYSPLVAGPIYDAWLHALFLGFVFNMIFAHALIILPALLGVNITFKNIFYLPSVLLQLSLIMRIIGDLTLQMDWRRWGGLLNALAILLFAVIIAGHMLISGVVRGEYTSGE